MIIYRGRDEKWCREHYDWHRWFAWYPIKIKTAWVWLEVVIRQYYNSGSTAKKRHKRLHEI